MSISDIIPFKRRFFLILNIQVVNFLASVLPTMQ